MRNRAGATIAGIGLILVGAYLLLGRMLALPGWEVWWPVLLILAGLATLVQGCSSPRHPGAVWFGVTATLCGALFFFITLGGARWTDMQDLWPLIPLAAGLGWIAAWLANRRRVPALVLGLLAGGAAAVGHAFTTRTLDRGVVALLGAWWPLILVALGLAFVAQHLLEGRSRDHRD